MVTIDRSRPDAEGTTASRPQIHELLEHPIRRLARLPRNGLSLLRETPGVLHRASRLYGLSPAATARRFRQLYKRRYTPKQAFLFGLFNPAVTERELDSGLSNHALHSLQEMVNPKTWEQFTEDKAVFYRYCETFGLPIPRLYAICARSTGGWSADHRRLVDPEDWDSFLRTIPAEEVVLKPAWGSYGRGVRILRRVEDGWMDNTGKGWTADSLIKSLQTDSGCDHFVLQERLHSHPDIHRFSPGPGLQTLRMTTYVDRDGQVHLLYTNLKLTTGGQIVDNFASGANGNFHLKIDTETGRMKQAFMKDPALGVLVEVSTHPVTNLDLRRIRIPSWEETRELAIRAAKAFLPVRAIGWDIAPTEHGPRLIEGNMWFDSPPTLGGSGDPSPFDIMISDIMGWV